MYLIILPYYNNNRPLIQTTHRVHWFGNASFTGFLLQLHLFRLRSPVRVVDGGVLEQGGEDKDEAHDEVDIDGLDVGDTREGVTNSRTDRRHRENGRYACRTTAQPQGNGQKNFLEGFWI